MDFSVASSFKPESFDDFESVVMRCIHSYCEKAAHFREKTRFITMNKACPYANRRRRELDFFFDENGRTSLHTYELMILCGSEKLFITVFFFANVSNHFRHVKLLLLFRVRLKMDRVQPNIDCFCVCTS